MVATGPVVSRSQTMNSTLEDRKKLDYGVVLLPLLMIGLRATERGSMELS